MEQQFEEIRKDGRLLYEYIRGSHLYNLNVETSDIDTSGIFACKSNELLGLGINYTEQVNDAKSDNTWYEIGKYISLLSKSNPTMLESLFVPKDKIIGTVHPLVQMIIDNKDEFISKDIFNSLFGYAVQQIEKARGLNKKINNPITKRLSPLDFVYTFYKQGSTKFTNWLDYRALSQEYCGLAKINNMHDTYGVYYDWGRFFRDNSITLKNLKKIHDEGICQSLDRMLYLITHTYNLFNCVDDFEWANIKNWYKSQKPLGYHGIISEDKDSNELRLSSIDKDEVPICHITYNQNGYTKHCIDYRNYKEWEKNRNPIRYESNLNQNYDSKNMMHCVRLMHMGLELAKGEGFNIERTWDREFLLDIRNHKFEYDYIIKYVEDKKRKFEDAIKTSTLREHVDINFVNDLLIKIRKEQINMF